MRIRVIGGGIAGALLGWRLAQQASIDSIDLFLGCERQPDATAVSGGVVRGYEPVAEQRDLAIDSLLELTADDRLRGWACYQEISSVYVVDDRSTLFPAAVEIGSRFPASVELLDPDELTARGWHGLPAAGGAIRERRAGVIDPDALRRAIVGDLTTRRRVSLHGGASPNLRSRDYDATVVSAGAWTPTLLEAAGVRGHGLRTKAIQYTIHRATGFRPSAFVDAISGLYGRPVADGLLLGLPTHEWDVAPGRSRPDLSLSAHAADLARARFPELRLGSAIRHVRAADCYANPGVLALRPAGHPAQRLYTFTGGSGGAAKSVLAASRQASSALVNHHTVMGRTIQ